jgi:hypothetical protein
MSSNGHSVRQTAAETACPLTRSTFEEWARALPDDSLHNAVREPDRTCRVCATPVDGFDLCWRCHEHRRIPGVADVVAPLIYAIPDTDSAALPRNYKNHPLRSERDPVQRRPPRAALAGDLPTRRLYWRSGRNPGITTRSRPVAHQPAGRSPFDIDRRGSGLGGGADVGCRARRAVRSDDGSR